MKISKRSKITSSKETADRKTDRRIFPTNVRYKGYMIRLDKGGDGYNVYDKHGELEDAGYASIEKAKEFVDELENEAKRSYVRSSIDEDPKWICLDIKYVRDSDGMLTDYALYTTKDEDKYICMFGDADVYAPDEMYADAEFDTEDEALEWFENYVGPGDEEDEEYEHYDILESTEVINSGYSPDLLNDLVNYYRSFDTMSSEEIWDEIVAEYNNEDLANDVLESLDDEDLDLADEEGAYDVYSSEDFEDHEDDLDHPDQEYDSAATSINSTKLPAIYRMIKLQPGTVGVDFGGGKFDNAIEYLRDQDVTLCVYDPYNRSAEHNREVLRTLRANRGADFAINSNVLNVIKEPEARKGVLENIKKITKSGAPIYITVYEGRGDAKEGVTKSGYQLNRKTADYLEEIQEVFPDATRKGKLIVATNSTSVNSSVDIKASSEIVWDEIRKAISGDKSAIQSLKEQGYKVRRLANPLQPSEIGTFEITDPATGETYNYDNTISHYGNTKVTGSNKLNRIVRSSKSIGKYFGLIYYTPDSGENGMEGDKFDLSDCGEFNSIEEANEFWHEYLLRDKGQAFVSEITKEEYEDWLAESELQKDWESSYKQSHGTVNGSTNEYSDIIEEIREQCNTKLIHIMAQYGFDESEAKQYSRVDASIEDNQYVRIEIGCELDYDGLMKVCQELDPIVQAYDPDSYFEPVDSGIAEAWVNLEKASIDSSSNIQAGAHDFPEPSLDPPEYPEPEEVDDYIQKIDLNLDAVIEIDQLGDWEYQDENYPWAKCKDTKDGSWYSDEYDVFIADPVSIVERVDELLISKLPEKEGTYRIKGNVHLEYVVSNLSKYVHSYGPDDYDEDIDTDNAYVDFDFYNSNISDFRLTKI